MLTQLAAISAAPSAIKMRICTPPAWLDRPLHHPRIAPGLLRPAPVRPEPLLRRFADTRFHEFVDAPHAGGDRFIIRIVIVEGDRLVGGRHEFLSLNAPSQNWN